ncbi:MAG: hypothetical protein H6R00_166 [Proteobacteria bacterium]|nr:hypothetical protein [Pseudomonadota bacterium]
MEPLDYRNQICADVDKAVLVPFRTVDPIDGWLPIVAKCHDNVDQWVKLHPGSRAVRGWLAYVNYGVSIGYTAHSVVQGSDGSLFDLTPTLGPNAWRGPFIAHRGSDALFCEMVKKLGQEIRCSGNCPAPELTFEDLLAATSSIAADDTEATSPAGKIS